MPHCSSVTSAPSSECSGAWLSTCSTGGTLPLPVTNTRGSTSISPSCRYQYVHISRSTPATSNREGRPSIDHSDAIHGPTATTTCSTAIGPAEVSTTVTAPDSSTRKPVTSTPSSIG